MRGGRGWEIFLDILGNNKSIHNNQPWNHIEDIWGTGSTGAVGVGVLFSGLLLPSVGTRHIQASPW